MTEPTTAAGRALNGQSDSHETYCRRWSGPFDDAARPCSCTLPDRLAAIEIEAAAAARTALLDELDLDSLAAAAHDAWYAEKLDRLVRLGRNSWPSETGEEQLVPWDQLSESVRQFDRIVVAAVLAAISRRRP